MQRSCDGCGGFLGHVLRRFRSPAFLLFSITQVGGAGGTAKNMLEMEQAGEEYLCVIC